MAGGAGGDGRGGIGALLSCVAGERERNLYELFVILVVHTRSGPTRSGTREFWI